MLRLFTDGGVIRKNPSPIGGTWAFILVDGEQVLDQGYGILSPQKVGSIYVTNNQTELYAVIRGLEAVYDDEVIEICSDSQVTLGRLFEGSPFNNIPTWMVDELKGHAKRLKNYKVFAYTLMDGHPTQEQIEKGTGKKGHVTSKYNVWCDEKCNEASRKYLEELQ